MQYAIVLQFLKSVTLHVGVITEWMTLYSVCLIYTLSEFVESRWLSKVLLWLMWLYIC